MTIDMFLPEGYYNRRSGQTPVAKRAAVHLSRRDGGIVVDPSQNEGHLARQRLPQRQLILTCMELCTRLGLVEYSTRGWFPTLFLLTVSGPV